MISECAGNAVWGLSSTFTFAKIHCLLQSFSESKNSKEFRIGFYVSTWSKLLSTLIPWCFCRSDSIPSITFLCFTLSLLLRSLRLRPQSTPLWHSTVCRVRPPSSLPIRFSAIEGSFVHVFLHFPRILTPFTRRVMVTIRHVRSSSRTTKRSAILITFLNNPKKTSKTGGNVVLKDTLTSEKS